MVERKVVSGKNIPNESIFLRGNVFDTKYYYGTHNINLLKDDSERVTYNPKTQIEYTPEFHLEFDDIQDMKYSWMDLLLPAAKLIGSEYSTVRNRKRIKENATEVSESLKDLLIYLRSEEEYSQLFSYISNRRHPPDIVEYVQRHIEENEGDMNDESIEEILSKLNKFNESIRKNKSLLSKLTTSSMKTNIAGLSLGVQIVFGGFFGVYDSTSNSLQEDIVYDNVQGFECSADMNYSFFAQDGTNSLNSILMSGINIFAEIAYSNKEEENFDFNGYRLYCSKNSGDYNISVNFEPTIFDTPRRVNEYADVEELYREEIKEDLEAKLQKISFN